MLLPTSSFALFLIICCSQLAAVGDRTSEFDVKSEAVAIKIAKAALEQKFGQPTVSKLKYFKASLKEDHWEVLGHPYKKDAIPTHGGTFRVLIAAKRGCVLGIIVEM